MARLAGGGDGDGEGREARAPVHLARDLRRMDHGRGSWRARCHASPAARSRTCLGSGVAKVAGAWRLADLWPTETDGRLWRVHDRTHTGRFPCDVRAEHFVAGGVS